MVSAGANSQMWGAIPSGLSRRRAVAPALFLLSARSSAADGVFRLQSLFPVAFGEARGLAIKALGGVLGRQLTQAFVVVAGFRSVVVHVPNMPDTRISKYAADGYDSCQAG